MIARRNRRLRRPAFTLTELLVVISVIVLILAMALPAFSSMLYSMALSTAQNSLHVAITSARDAAVRSAYGQDSAAVFTFTPNGRLTVIPCVEVGTLTDQDANNDPVEREVFIPARGVEPVQLPQGWAVSGLATLHTIDGPEDPNFSGWYDSGNYPADQVNWVFPETHIFGADDQGLDIDDGRQGDNRQTFMIRFEGGTGAIAMAESQAVLVVLPSPSIDFRTQAPWLTNRLDRATDLDRAVKRILAGDPNNDGVINGADDAVRIDLLGDGASDTILARPVPEIALYSLSKAAGAAGASGLSRRTNALIATNGSGDPVYDPFIFGGAPDAPTIAQRLNEWIVGDLQINNIPIESDAMVYSFQRYLGEPQELIQPETP
jgi:prepilin-type N-terminal cleavage/methylation domain-containing protein